MKYLILALFCSVAVADNIRCTLHLYRDDLEVTKTFLSLNECDEFGRKEVRAGRYASYLCAVQ